MFFITYEKSFYELLKKYLLQNRLINESIPIASYNHGLVVRAKDLGFSKLDNYCRYALLLPFRDKMEEIRFLNLSYRPLYFGQHKEQIKAISHSLILKILQEEHKEEIDKEENTSVWLAKIIELGKTEIKIGKSQEKKLVVKILGAQSAEGEEIYEVAMRLNSISADEFVFEVKALESDGRFIKKAKQGIYHRGKILQLQDSYRSLYFEKTKEGLYQVVEPIRRPVKFIQYDILTNGIRDEDRGKYHLIFCNNLRRFYPFSVAKHIISLLLPCLVPGGLLFTKFASGDDIPKFSGTKIYSEKGAFAYQRTFEPLDEVEQRSISDDVETEENLFIYLKALFLDERYNTARRRVENFLRQKIDSIVGYHFLGDIYVKLGEYDKAISQYKRTLIIDPLFLPARLNVALLYAYIGAFEKATKNIREARENLSKIDIKKISSLFNVKEEYIPHLISFVEEAIESGEIITQDDFLRELDLHRKIVVELPDIEVPDPFAERKEKEEESKLPTGERKVVNIAELPSTRDYGEHDPWKIKMKQEEERRRREEEERRRREEEERRKQEEKKKEEEQVRAEIEEPEGGVVEEEPERPIEEVVPKRKTVRLDTPARALFLDNISPDDLNLPPNLLKKFKSKMGGEASKPPEKKEPSPKVTSVAVPQKKEVLPPKFRATLEMYIERKNVTGIINLLDQYIAITSGEQKELLILMRRMCTVFFEKLQKLVRTRRLSP